MMIVKLTTLSLFVLLFSLPVLAQDTIVVAKNERYKFGTKLIYEKSEDYEIFDDGSGYHLFCFGFQAIRRIKQTKSSLESGIYFNTKAFLYEAIITPPSPNYSDRIRITVYHHYLTIPLNYRLDTKSIYFSAGIFGDIPLYHDARIYEAYVDSIENYGTDRNFYLGWNVNLGMEKSITYKINLFVEARVAVTVSSLKTEDGGFIMTSGNIGSSNINYGFAIGVNYKLLRKPG